jgi:ribosome maturation factor RimP
VLWGFKPRFYIRMFENKIVNIVEPLVHGNGCELWGIDLIRGKSKPIVRIYIDAIGGATIDDCEKISHDINFELPADDELADFDYILEVSTPGIERKFFSANQMKNYLGELVSIKLREGNHLIQGKKVLTLVGVEDENILLEDEQHNRHTVQFASIQTCNLSPDFRALLNEGKK